MERDRVYDIGAKVAGVVIAGGVGMLVGEILDNIPQINQASALYQFIKESYEVNLQGHLDKVFGAIGALYGYFETIYFHGKVLTFEGKPFTLSGIHLPPFFILKKTNKS